MSPILLRPIREQVEHDKVIRQLQTRWRRRFDVAANLGSTEEASVRVASQTLYPDLVLTSTASGRRLHGVVEVETAESVNHLEAVAEWKHFGKARGAFYLYVPAGFTDVAERLCHAAQINVTEIWAYYSFGSQVKFSMTYRSPRARTAAKAAKTRAKAAKSSPTRTAKPAKKKKTAAKGTAKTARSATGKASRTRRTAATREKVAAKRAKASKG